MVDTGLTRRSEAVVHRDPESCDVPNLELMLFTTDADLAREAEAAGVNLIVVDWETEGKDTRQREYDTEINRYTTQDLERISRAVLTPVTRINGYSSATSDEVQRALDHGARYLMLPMARTIGDVEAFLEIVGQRARTIVQIETQALVDAVQELPSLPWDAAYIGLNDLMIDRGARSLWDVLADGTVDRIGEALQGRTFGLAAATVVGGGYPLRCTMIMGELARVGATLTTLRRTFLREIQDRNLADEIAALRALWAALHARGPHAIESDRTALLARVEKLRSAST